MLLGLLMPLETVGFYCSTWLSQVCDAPFGQQEALSEATMFGVRSCGCSTCMLPAMQHSAGAAARPHHAPAWPWEYVNSPLCLDSRVIDLNSKLSQEHHHKIISPVTREW